MPQQALREAVHKWHSSQSCFQVSFLTLRGICKPTTLASLFFSQTVTQCRDRPKVWGGSRWCASEAKWEHSELFYLLCRCRHNCCFSGQSWLSSGGQTSFLICSLQRVAAGMMNAVSCWRKEFVVICFEACCSLTLLCCGCGWLSFIILVSVLYLSNERLPN